MTSMWCLHQPGVSCVVSSRRHQHPPGGLEQAARRAVSLVWNKSGDNTAPQDLLVSEKHRPLLQWGVSTAAWTSRRS